MTSTYYAPNPTTHHKNPIKSPPSRTRYHNLEIMSWNMQDCKIKDEGKKTDDKRFLDILNSTLIFCLQETKGEIKIPNYRCYNSLRKRSRSGGVCIGVHQSITKGIKHLNNTNCPDIQAIKLTKTFFKLKKDIIIVNVYNSPQNSSYKHNNSTDETSIIEKASQYISSFDEDLTNIIIMGDFNARIAHKEDFILSDNCPDGTISFNSPHEHELNPRNSKDLACNTNNQDFLDLLISNSLKILNGRTIGDIFGEFTCLKYNGRSIVDYIAISDNLIPKINYFKVDSFTPFSDHKPIRANFQTDSYFTITNDLLNFKFENITLGFKWNKNNNESAINFLNAQNSPPHNERISMILDSSYNSPEDVLTLTNQLTKTFNSLSHDCLQKKKIPNGKRNNPWFDIQCRLAKRKLSTLSRKYGKNPLDTNIRTSFYSERKIYKKLINERKNAYFTTLNQNIENGDVLDWKSFKKLKNHHSEEDIYDSYDLLSFFCHFKDLYSGNTSINRTRTNDLADKTDTIVHHIPSIELLENPITAEELNGAISKLKLGKSVAEDLISNEMIRSSGTDLRKAILKLFNLCLNYSTYPWNSSLITPIHKKGDKYSPDNFRAIAVGSCLGKLLSNILLHRLVDYRQLNCPDPPNQLGFCPNARTCDHILTLKTIIDKYARKQNIKVFTCFVDFKKAFDLVCREALLYKIANLGIGGKFFNIIKYMYQHSTAKVKLLNKLSEKIDVLVGTEQGHPMSPEFFKIFIRDLSEMLEIPCNVPLIDTLRISHLLWADDLVLTALDQKSLQSLLDQLNNFCELWGLSVNLDKTKVMIFQN